ncbi:hypothetical protein ACFLXQ_05440, partial [Chloroflexota bacterium]
LTGESKDYAQSLNQHSDVILVTYYPRHNDGTVQEPTVVATDFQTLVSLYPQKQIFFSEAGYPSGTQCNSSEAKQAQFVREVFKAWDAHANQIQFIHFSWLTDLSEVSVAESTQYYDSVDPCFVEFLSTLGLRTYSGSGTDKEAFRTLKAEAEARGW